MIEDTNLYSTADWTTFRSTFGLSGYTAGTFTQVHPRARQLHQPRRQRRRRRGDPRRGVGQRRGAQRRHRARLLQGHRHHVRRPHRAPEPDQRGQPAAIISISYGECEAENGAAANAAFERLPAGRGRGHLGLRLRRATRARRAATPTRPTPPTASASAASPPPRTTSPSAAPTSATPTPGTNSTYWSATNTATYGSARRYIPEIPWNDSCASALLATYVRATARPTAPAGSATAPRQGRLPDHRRGSGGPSGCATGAASTSGVVSGTCAGYAKPSWQSLLGVPATACATCPTSRCSRPTASGATTTSSAIAIRRRRRAPAPARPTAGPAPAAPRSRRRSWPASRRWSTRRPGRPQGNPNSIYYQLAATEYGASGSATCNSTSGNDASAASCIFYDVTQGDIDVNCTGTHNCYLPGGQPYGVLSTVDRPPTPRPTAPPPAGTSPPASARSTPTTWSTTGNPRRDLFAALYFVRIEKKTGAPSSTHSLIVRQGGVSFARANDRLPAPHPYSRFPDATRPKQTLPQPKNATSTETNIIPTKRKTSSRPKQRTAPPSAAQWRDPCICLLLTPGKYPATEHDK